VRPRFPALWAAPASWSVESPNVDLILRSLFPFGCALIRPSRNASASSRVPNSATIFRVRRLTTMKSFKAPDSRGEPTKLPTSDANQEGCPNVGIDANEGSCVMVPPADDIGRPICVDERLPVALRRRRVLRASRRDINGDLRGQVARTGARLGCSGVSHVATSAETRREKVLAASVRTTRFAVLRRRAAWLSDREGARTTREDGPLQRSISPRPLATAR
jgi:hypothetical protein